MNPRKADHYAKSVSTCAWSYSELFTRSRSTRQHSRHLPHTYIGFYSIKNKISSNSMVMQLFLVAFTVCNLQKDLFLNMCTLFIINYIKNYWNDLYKTPYTPCTFCRTTEICSSACTEIQLFNQVIEQTRILLGQDTRKRIACCLHYYLLHSLVTVLTQYLLCSTVVIVAWINNCSAFYKRQPWHHNGQPLS